MKSGRCFPRHYKYSKFVQTLAKLLRHQRQQVDGSLITATVMFRVQVRGILIPGNCTSPWRRGPRRITSSCTGNQSLQTPN